MPAKRKPNAEWQKVFMLAVAEAKKLQKESGGKLTYMQCVPKAWKTKVVMEAKAAYDKKHKK